MDPSGCMCCQIPNYGGSARAFVQHPAAAEKLVHRSNIGAEPLLLLEIEETDHVDGQKSTGRKMERGDPLHAHQQSRFDSAVSCYSAQDRRGHPERRQVVDTGLDTVVLLGSAAIAGFDLFGCFVSPTIGAERIGNAEGLVAGSVAVEFGTAFGCLPEDRRWRV